MFALLLLIPCLAAKGPVATPSRTHHALSFGAQLHYLYYKEDVEPPRKSTERNAIPGLFLRHSMDFDQKFELENRFELNFGRTFYDGSTQDGAPAEGDTTNQMFVWEILGKYPVSSIVKPYLGFGLRYWNRDSSGSEGGYGEKYYILYVPMGVSINAVEKESFSLGVDLSLLWTIGGRISFFLSDADPSLQDTAGSLGMGLGFRAEFPAKIPLSAQWKMRFIPFLQLLSIGEGGQELLRDSSGRPVVQDGSNVLIHEPASQTWLFGIMIGPQWNF